MLKPLRVLAGLIALGLAGAGSSANAQGIYYNGPGLYGPRYYHYGPRYYAGGLAPWQVMRVVRSAGFTTIGAPLRRGRSYVVTALRRDGDQVRVVVDAYEGAIVSVRPALAMRRYRGPVPPSDPRDAVAPPPYSDEAAAEPPLRPQASMPGTGRAPLLPRPTPSQQLANAPETTGAIARPAQTARTPMPRPRPKVAANVAAPAATPVAASPTAASPPAAKPAPVEVPEAPPAPRRTPTKMVPVAPLD